tara:strand:+ start:2269 stop:3549 length:1281 start_codon:yes stop_codon:yes gene_type:complete
MVTETNPFFYSKNDTNNNSYTQIEDAVDFPHTGLIKALSAGIRGNYAIRHASGSFNITQANSNPMVSVATGGVFLDNEYKTTSAATFDDTVFKYGSDNPVENARFLLVVQSSNHTLQVRKNSTNVANKIPPMTLGDVPIAVLTFTSGGFGSMQVQFLTTNKAANSLSIGFANSDNYSQTLSITGSGSNTGETIIESHANRLHIRLDGNTSSQYFQIGDQNGTMRLRVAGDGTITTLLTANRALISNASSELAVSPVTNTELALLSGAAFGIGSNNILRANANLADNDFLRVDGTQIEGRTAAETLADIGAYPASGGNIGGSVNILHGNSFRAARLSTVSVSGGTTLTENTHAGFALICAGNVTLPATSSIGEQYLILNTTNGNITVSPSVSTNINGGSNGAAITVATYNAVTCISIGSNNWIALGV